MQQLISLIRYEFRMSISRKGLWIVYAALFVIYALIVFAPMIISERATEDVILSTNYWQFAGEYAINFNLFLPVAVGILASDRIQRDQRLLMSELQNSTPIKLSNYILAKFTASFGSLWIPVFAWQILTGLVLALLGKAPWQMAYALPIAGLVISVPAYAFVIAYSLFFPLIMPLRVYQILFTGYWFWGNFVPPESFPTLNGTIVTPAGFYAYQGFFGGFHGADTSTLEYTSLEAVINILVILALSGFALLILNLVMNQRRSKA